MPSVALHRPGRGEIAISPQCAQHLTKTTEGRKEGLLSAQGLTVRHGHYVHREQGGVELGVGGSWSH